MSSHREAPEISKDPVADSTDVYAFVSPDRPDTVTIISNYIPLEGPAGGPNFFEFGDDVLYSLYIDNDGDAKPDITYQFQFTTQVQNANTFLYNTGPIGSLDDANWNRRQFYSVTRTDRKNSTTVLGDNLPSPPCNIGPRSTPGYAALATAAVRDPTDPLSGKAVLGVWAGASRRKVRMTEGPLQSGAGPWVQVSRLGNPLFNEVIVPMARKDEWNARDPVDDKDFAAYVRQPELGKLLPVLYPGVFPHLAGLTASR